MYPSDAGFKALPGKICHVSAHILNYSIPLIVWLVLSGKKKQTTKPTKHHKQNTNQKTKKLDKGFFSLFLNLNSLSDVWSTMTFLWLAELFQRTYWILQVTWVKTGRSYKLFLPFLRTATSLTCKGRKKQLGAPGWCTCTGSHQLRSSWLNHNFL